jgi:hypothetical protein
MKIKDVVIKEANIVPYQPNLPAVPNTAPSTLVNNPNVIDQKFREVPDKIQKATKAARPAVGAALVPAAVAAGGATLSNVAANQMAAMTPQQRQQFYDDPMIGAMSGDAGLAGAIMNQAEKNAQQPAPAAQAAQPAAAPKPPAAKPPAAKPAAPKKAAPASGKVPPQPTLNGKPSTGPKGQAWLKKYGATHNPDGTPKAAVDPSIDPYDPKKDPNVAQVPASDGSSAELDRLKQLAIGGTQQPPAAPAQGTNTDIGISLPADKPAASPAPNVNALGVTQGGGVANALQPAPQADKPAPPAPAPALAAAPNSGSSYTGDIGTATNDVPATQAAQPANVNPDTGASTVKPEVKSGTGSTWKTGSGGTLRSSSDDEIAWANASPQNRFNPNAYPGPGNWDPKTGRTKTDPNAPGFFDRLFGNKKSDAGPAGNVNNQSSGYTQTTQTTQGQAAQPAPAPGSMGTLTPDQIATINQNFGPKKEDISILRKLAGLK